MAHEYEITLAADAGPLERQVRPLVAALELAMLAMRAPLDGWKGEVERRALDAAREALLAFKCADPFTDWPCARISIDESGLPAATMYAPGLPPGEHYVWCVPLDLRWRSVAEDGLPPCDGETVFIGVNSAGFAACFNAMNPDGVCLMGGPESCTAQMSELRYWRRLDMPQAA